MNEIIEKYELCVITSGNCEVIGFCILQDNCKEVARFDVTSSEQAAYYLKLLRRTLE